MIRVYRKGYKQQRGHLKSITRQEKCKRTAVSDYWMGNAAGSGDEDEVQRRLFLTCFGSHEDNCTQ